MEESRERSPDSEEEHSFVVNKLKFLQELYKAQKESGEPQAPVSVKVLAERTSRVDGLPSSGDQLRLQYIWPLDEWGMVHGTRDSGYIASGPAQVTEVKITDSGKTAIFLGSQIVQQEKLLAANSEHLRVMSDETKRLEDKAEELKATANQHLHLVDELATGVVGITAKVDKQKERAEVLEKKMNELEIGMNRYATRIIEIMAIFTAVFGLVIAYGNGLTLPSNAAAWQVSLYISAIVGPATGFLLLGILTLEYFLRRRWR